ncbi:related to TRS33 - subunit of the transport protein particle complex [Ustilago sp. UG-2017a]|nr:related to TRS33 - subunit of the transport protein particle complex [Ustilago sp. UG-2017a]
MSKPATAAAGSSSTPGIERLSLGSAFSPSSSRPSHALPNLSIPVNAGASGSGDGTPSGSSASLITPELLDLATPAPHYVDSQALHSLATEMVHTLIQSSRFVSRKQSLARENLRLAGINIPPPTRPVSIATTTGPNTTASTSSSAHNEVVRSVSCIDDSETLTEVGTLLTTRLESIGYHVGYHLTQTLARDRARFTDTLDVLKFICKEVWTAVWGKQVDNLRTNHRGVYVLHDNQFQPLRHASTAQGPAVTAKEARVFLSYSVGIVKGALSQLDVTSVVVAETNQAPGCTFHVKTQQKPATTAAGQAIAGTNQAAAGSAPASSAAAN